MIKRFPRMVRRFPRVEEHAEVPINKLPDGTVFFLQLSTGKRTLGKLEYKGPGSVMVAWDTGKRENIDLETPVVLVRLPIQRFPRYPKIMRFPREKR
jgi:hypothetical protein